MFYLLSVNNCFFIFLFSYGCMLITDSCRCKIMKKGQIISSLSIIRVDDVFCVSMMCFTCRWCFLRTFDTLCFDMDQISFNCIILSKCVTSRNNPTRGLYVILLYTMCSPSRMSWRVNRVDSIVSWNLPKLYQYVQFLWKISIFWDTSFYLFRD